MKNNNIILLKEAFKAFRKKRFPEAIVLLEKIITYTHDPYPYFLLCISYLLSDRFSKAEIIIQKLRRINPDYLPLLQLDSFLFLKSASSIHQVIASYIDRLDQFPKDKYFKKALKNLRKTRDFNHFQKNAKLTRFVSIPKPHPKISDYSHIFHEKPARKKANPKPYGTINKKIKIAVFAVCLSAIIFGTYYYFHNQYLKPGNLGNNKIFPIDSVNIDVFKYNLIDKIKIQKPPIFYFSNEEVINDFNKAKFLIKDEKYNEALIIINKIASSNANYRVKERTDFLRKFISDIEYRAYSNIPVEKIIKTPYLYRGVFVKWEGKITNLKEKDDKLVFNLLVDYKEDDIFNGIIDVYSEREKDEILNGDLVTIEGTFINSIGSDNRIYLVADKITRLNK